MTTEEAVRKYLTNKHVTLWADWDLSNQDSFEKAVAWLTAEVEGVMATKNELV